MYLLSVCTFMLFLAGAASAAEAQSTKKPNTAPLEVGNDPQAASDILSVQPGKVSESGPTTAYLGAQLLTGTGQIIASAALVVADGKIVAVGATNEVTIPAGANRVDLTGRVIIPGLVDSHSHLGVYSRPAESANSDGNETTNPVQTSVRALDSVNPLDPGIRMAVAGGVTTANIMPGSANVIGGQTVYVKLRGRTIDQMQLLAHGVHGGLKMANGENPKRSYGTKGQAPVTRMKLTALQRSEFIKAQNYRNQWTKYRHSLAKGETPTPPAIDLGLETLVEVLERQRTVHFHTHRADDILTVLRLREEFGFELVIQHGTESYKVADRIAAAKVPVSMTVVDVFGGKAEVMDLIDECGAKLAEKGVTVLVNTDDPVTESRFFLRTAAIPVRGGLTEELALKAITSAAATAMHLDQRLGSLEEGKDADFVVLSGPPFSIFSRVLQTYIDGIKVFDLQDPVTQRYQVGGFALAAPEQQIAPLPVAVLESPIPAKPVPEHIKKMQAEAELKVTAAETSPPVTKSQTYIYASRLHTVRNGTIEAAAILLEADKIVALGKADEIAVPPGAKVLSAVEVTPGFLDAHSVVPLSGAWNITADQDADESSGPEQPELRVLDAFNPREPLLGFLLSQGVTVIHACPGEKNTIAGQSGVFRTWGSSAADMAIQQPFAMVFNLGTSAKSAYPGREPNTRMANAAVIRKALARAVDYRRKLAAQPEAAADLERDLGKEALAAVLDGKMRAFFCAHRADDLLTGLRIADEFKLKPILGTATESYLIMPELQQAKVPVFLHPTMQRVGDLETLHSCLGTAANLQQAQIPIAICSGYDRYVPKARSVRHEAGMAMVYGMGFDQALRSVTLQPAEQLGIADRWGSLEVGKKADLVLYDGHPFEYRTQVQFVLVDGAVVYDRAAWQQLPFWRRLYLNTTDPGCCLDL